MKKGALGTSPRIFSTSDLSSNDFAIDFSGDSLNLWGYNSATVQLLLTTTAVYRDPSAWYHVVVVIDTTQATSSNRAKIFVNGSQVTAFSTATYPPQNTNFRWNSTAPARIGIYQTGSSAFDGYLAEMYFIDGQALTPSSFGSTNATTGVWQPAKYTGSYGTNGFYLPFSDIGLTSGSNTGLGKDFSGNSNYWTTNNISVTAGATYDAMTDSPTLTSATVANYAVLNPNSAYGNTNVTISSANLNLQIGVSGQWRSFSGSTVAMEAGNKYYYEVTLTNSITLGDAAIGVAASTLQMATGSVYPSFYSTAWTYTSDALKANNNTASAYGATWNTAGDVIGVALDMTTGSLTFYKNGVSQGVAFTLPTTNSYVACFGGATTIPQYAVNFGQRPFSYTPPTGFVALNTFNLPTSAVVKGNSVMDATLYTGNNTTNTITNAGGFKPDVVWVKNRSGGYGHNHVLVDSIRGGSNKLFPNLTNAQSTSSVAYSSLNSNGFTLENSGGANNDMNESGFSYVAWQWQAGQGSTSSNTSGSITSTVSVNANAGVSIVAYTNSAGRATHTVGHGLGVAPRMFIIKTRSATADWVVYHASLGATQALYLNQTLSAQTSSTFFNNTAPTSTVITLGSGLSDAGVTIVAYCFAEIAGFSRFGSYVANASSDGPFIYTGFRPRWIMFKRTTSATNWYVIDTSISPINASTSGLYPNTTAEVSTEGAVDILSNGFKCRVSSGAFNFPSGETFAYVAFAENPFKNALAR